MLSGQEESDLARRHAAELLDLPSWDHGRR
jgi:hypothetical protein